MRLNTPLITLLSGAALGGGLVIARSMATPPAVSPYAAAATPGATAGPGGGTTTNAGATTAPSTSAPSSPAAPHVPGRADFTGPVSGGGATVAVSVRGGKAIGFVCTTSGTATWLTGAAAARLRP